MRKLLNNPKVVGLLASAAVVFIGWNVLGEDSPVRLRSAASVDGGDLTSMAGGQDDFSSGDRRSSIVEALRSLVIPEGVRDPFTRVRVEDLVVQRDEEQEQPDTTESVRLTAVWEQGSSLLVVINGRIREVGDKIGRLTIESATRDGVWLTHWNGRDFLPFGDNFTLVTPATETANSTPASDDS